MNVNVIDGKHFCVQNENASFHVNTENTTVSINSKHTNLHFDVEDGNDFYFQLLGNVDFWNAMPFTGKAEKADWICDMFVSKLSDDKYVIAKGQTVCLIIRESKYLYVYNCTTKRLMLEYDDSIKGDMFLARIGRIICDFDIYMNRYITGEQQQDFMDCITRTFSGKYKISGKKTSLVKKFTEYCFSNSINYAEFIDVQGKLLIIFISGIIYIFSDDAGFHAVNKDYKWHYNI